MIIVKPAFTNTPGKTPNERPRLRNI
jgi:hypothetical protein